MTARLTLILAAASAAALALPPQHEALAGHARQLLDARVYELGLDRSHGFQVRSVHGDRLLGEEDVRVQQEYRGVKVLEGDAVLHLSGGRMRGLVDGFKRNIRLDVTPTLTAGEARARAHAALNPAGPYVAEPAVELVVAPFDHTVEDRRGRARTVRTFALAYHVHAELENGAMETAHTDLLVDAHSGRILDRWSTLMTSGAKGTGRSQYNGTVTLDTNSTASGYELNDLVRSAGNKTYNLNHATSGTGTIYTDADNTWGDGANYVEGSDTTAANGQTAGVDAAYGLQATWDMFKNVFGRNGIDGTGKATYSRVHYSSNYDNAFWSSSCFCMTYGDGSSFSTLTSLDVAGHEMTHGVCDYSAKLTYRGESGGLNEANSDIFGALAEFYARGGAAGTVVPNHTDIGGMIQVSFGTVPAANYLIGEQLATPSYNKPLRWMYKPSLDGRSPNAWSKSLGRMDVHYSSGPANLWFFLLAHGSQVDAFSGNIQAPMANGVTSIAGIGNHKAGQIWYRALTKYMTSSTNYAGARTATLNAATDLFGAASAEYAAVNKAWLAVNVK